MPAAATPAAMAIVRTDGTRDGGRASTVSRIVSSFVCAGCPARAPAAGPTRRPTGTRGTARPSAGRRRRRSTTAGRARGAARRPAARGTTARGTSSSSASALEPAVGRDVQHARDGPRARRARARATTSSTCTTWNGGAAPRTRDAVGPVSSRAQRCCAPAPSTGAARRVVIVTAGWSCCHSASSRSTSAACTAALKPGLGRSGASSVSGSGLVGPRAVRRGGREADDLAHADRGRGVEHAPRALDVDARHQRLVGDRVDDRREVHEHVDALEQRLQVVAGDVDPVQLEAAETGAAARARRGRRSGRCPVRPPDAGSRRCPRKPATPVTATVRELMRVHRLTA